MALSDKSRTILRELETDFIQPMRKRVKSPEYPENLSIDKAYNLIISKVQEDERAEVASRFRTSISALSTRAWWWSSWLNDNWYTWVDIFDLTLE